MRMDFFHLNLSNSGDCTRTPSGYAQHPAMIHHSECALFVRWLELPRPILVGDCVRVVRGYHGGSSADKNDHRYAKVLGVHGSIAWLSVFKHDVPSTSWVRSEEPLSYLELVTDLSSAPEGFSC